jgi:rhamnopyranosyl-N-acetylglucosaminyl-diphospho-decaprenol beta-1,3/1,4-galactofuranosyltransferase
MQNRIADQCKTDLHVRRSAPAIESGSLCVSVRPVKPVAVVVTHNRRHDLLNCLEGLHAQSFPIHEIILINNASTDATSAAVREYYPNVTLVDVANNLGGAGGFALGLALALQSDATHAWLMDDDVIPDAGALGSLVEAISRYEAPPALATTLVLGLDRNLGPRNKCEPAPVYERLVGAARHGHVAIRHCSFVAPLIDLSVAAKTHLPLADFFLWHDDTEYTARICRIGSGVLVPDSTVVHLAQAAPPGQTLGPRLVYDLRNRIWLARQRDCLLSTERVAWLVSVWRIAFTQLRLSRNKWATLGTILKAVAVGVAHRPRHDSADDFLRRHRNLILP